MFITKEYNIIGKLKLIHSFESKLTFEPMYDGDKPHDIWYLQYNGISIHPLIHDNFAGTQLSAFYMRFTKFLFEPLYMNKPHSGTKEYGFVLFGIWFTVFLEGFEIIPYENS